MCTDCVETTERGFRQSSGVASRGVVLTTNFTRHVSSTTTTGCCRGSFFCTFEAPFSHILVVPFFNSGRWHRLARSGTCDV